MPNAIWVVASCCLSHQLVLLTQNYGRVFCDHRTCGGPRCSASQQLGDSKSPPRCWSRSKSGGWMQAGKRAGFSPALWHPVSNLGSGGHPYTMPASLGIWKSLRRSWMRKQRLHPRSWLVQPRFPLPLWRTRLDFRLSFSVRELLWFRNLLDIFLEKSVWSNYSTVAIYMISIALAWTCWQHRSPVFPWRFLMFPRSEPWNCCWSTAQIQRHGPKDFTRRWWWCAKSQKHGATMNHSDGTAVWPRIAVEHHKTSLAVDPSLRSGNLVHYIMAYQIDQFYS